MKDLSQLPEDLKEKFENVKEIIGDMLLLRAKKRLEAAGSQANYRVAGISGKMWFEVDGNTIILGNAHPYAAYFEFGTGILGPEKEFIKAKPGKWIVFPKSDRYKRSNIQMPSDQIAFEGKKEWSGLIFTKYSRGIAPLRFMRGAIDDVRPKIPSMIMEVFS